MAGREGDFLPVIFACQGSKLNLWTGHLESRSVLLNVTMVEKSLIPSESSGNKTTDGSFMPEPLITIMMFVIYNYLLSLPACDAWTVPE